MEPLLPSVITASFTPHWANSRDQQYLLARFVYDICLALLVLYPVVYFCAVGYSFNVYPLVHPLQVINCHIGVLVFSFDFFYANYTYCHIYSAL